MATHAQWPPNDRRPRRALPRHTDSGVIPEAEANLARRMHEARLRAFLEEGSGTDDPGDLPDGLEALVARTAGLYSQAINESTRKTYARRWRLFITWCEERGLEPLPATSEAVMLYLSDAMSESSGASLGTLRGWLAAINRIHVEAGYSPPGDDPAMTMFLRTLSRAVPPRSPVEQVSALRIADLRSICRALDAVAFDPVEVRDRALLALHRSGVGDGELARLRWEDVHLTTRSATLLLRSPRPDRKDRMVRIRAHADEALCGVSALRAWRQSAGTEVPWLMTQVDHAGGRAARAWGSRDIRRIRLARLDSLGRDGEPAALDTAIGLLGGSPSEVLRDKAMLLLGFAGAFRRTDVVGLRWPDVTFSDSGLIVRLRRSKTDREGIGVDVGIPRGSSAVTCPVTAMEGWRARFEQQLGADAGEPRPCFTRVGRAGRIGTQPLTPEGVTMMVRKRAEEVGLHGKWGGRSLRRGFISTAADLGIRLEDIAKQSRHATLDSLVLYIASDDPFRNNPASRLGL